MIYINSCCIMPEPPVSSHGNHDFVIQNINLQETRTQDQRLTIFAPLSAPLFLGHRHLRTMSSLLYSPLHSTICTVLLILIFTRLVLLSNLRQFSLAVLANHYIILLPSLLPSLLPTNLASKISYLWIYNLKKGVYLSCRVKLSVYTTHVEKEAL